MQYTEMCVNALLRTNTGGRADSVKGVPAFMTPSTFRKGGGGRRHLSSSVCTYHFHLLLFLLLFLLLLFLLLGFCSDGQHSSGNLDMSTEAAFSMTATLYAVLQLPRQGNKGKSVLGQFSVQVSIRSIPLPTHCSV